MIKPKNKKKIQSSFQQKQAALRTPVERGNSSVKRSGIGNTKLNFDDNTLHNVNEL
ncbi:hypothetical protein DICPUDRAFT_158721 [Dictyostelium purpureum]|uniref:Uncharacterized protein n=1 Tax=Dictyostelium purpureum TaxID=5786 RepID=F1A2A9_DICPU|nr:uncharacterized protein DICPUDRAFT_158721 [Dictyostelium purpureum]EGC29666.1 hypothetical protein DICPUDRAFT_158721 [Dictyostelium purpureum]|eukprot:XP_003293799.1 hypothetical protein DICPUDRAFT_158721 [Dictyostelium purpureum]